MLKISQHELDMVLQHAERAYPQECCGILIGERQANVKTVRVTFPSDNVCEERPESRYQIAATELVRVQREVRGRGLEIVGFYHSHPDHPASWSQADLDEALWVGCAYVIVEVRHGRAGGASSFALQVGPEGSRWFEEETIVVQSEHVIT